jgi:WD40 repeat protein
MLIAGIILLIIGFGWFPLIKHFWQPGLFGTPTPRGWRGVMNQVANIFFFLTLFTAVVRVPLFLVCIAVGLALTVAGMASLVGISHFPTLLSMGVSAVIVVLVVLFLQYRRTLAVTLSETFGGALPELIRSRRDRSAHTHTLAVFSDQAQAVTALQWLPATDQQREKLIVASSSPVHPIYYWTPKTTGSVLVDPYRHPSALDVSGFASADVTDLALSPDHRYLAASSVDGHVQFFENQLPELTRTRGILAQELLNLSEEQAGLRVKQTQYFPSHPLASVNTVAWAPSFPYRIAFGASDRTVKIWHIGADLLDTRHTAFPLEMERNVQQCQMLTYHAHQASVTALAWSPQGEFIASASVDATIHIWNANTGETQCRYDKRQGAVNDLAWSPNGEWIASASADRSVQVWRADTTQNLLSYQEHEGPVLAIDWSPDGRWIASAGQDHVVRVWDAMSGHTYRIYQRQRKTILALAWSSESQRIASAGEDGIVHVWEIRA